MKKRKSKVIDKKLINALIARLDALIRLHIEENKKIYGKMYKESTFARLLHSVGLTPTEIARIFGKKSASDVAPYLYSKKK